MTQEKKILGKERDSDAPMSPAVRELRREVRLIQLDRKWEAHIREHYLDSEGQFRRPAASDLGILLAGIFALVVLMNLFDFTGHFKLSESNWWVYLLGGLGSLWLLKAGMQGIDEFEREEREYKAKRRRIERGKDVDGNS